MQIIDWIKIKTKTIYPNIKGSHKVTYTLLRNFFGLDNHLLRFIPGELNVSCKHWDFQYRNNKKNIFKNNKIDPVVLIFLLKIKIDIVSGFSSPFFFQYSELNVIEELFLSIELEHLFCAGHIVRKSGRYTY